MPVDFIVDTTTIEDLNNYQYSLIDNSSFFVSSNILSKQNFINSNSITDNLSFHISSNILSKQRYINSNSIIDNLNFYISSNFLSKQNYINSNSIIDDLSFFISSNTLSKQKYINSNSITDNLSKYLPLSGGVLTNTLNGTTINASINLQENNINLSSKYIKYVNETEKLFPPKLYNSSTSEITTTFLGKTVYYQTFTLNTTDITYGSGVYEIYASTSYLTDKLTLFNFINHEAYPHWGNNQYNQPSGTYNGANFIVDDGFIGDWIILKLPTSISLSKFSFYQRTDIPSRSPALYRTYGSIDGINFIRIAEASNEITAANYINNIHTNVLSTPSLIYNYIGFTFNKLVGGDNYAVVLNFAEIKIYGYEAISYLQEGGINLEKKYISSNILSQQKYINSNSIIDNLSFFISSNILSKQNYINSNSIIDNLSFIVSSNILSKQNFINSNSIIDNLKFYISSNTLSKQNYINSNSIIDNISFYVSSNILSKQNYINSNSVIDNLNFYISSNILSKQNYINSNSILNILNPYLTSNSILGFNYASTSLNILNLVASNVLMNIINNNDILSTGNIIISKTSPKCIIRGTDETQIISLLFGTPYLGVSANKVGIIAEGINNWSRAKLHFCLDNTANNTSPTYDASISNSRMTIIPSGYVGIGSTIPTQVLDVVGNITAIGNITIRSNPANTWVRLNGGDTTRPGFLEFFNSGTTRLAYIGWSTTANFLDFNFENGYQGIIFNNKIGIGTTPGFSLTVNGEIKCTILSTGFNHDHIRLFHDGIDAYFQVGGIEGGIRFQTNSLADGAYPSSYYNERMVIKNNGNVGINSASPQQLLDVGGNIKGNALLLNTITSTSVLSVNNQVIDRNTYDHSLACATITHQTATRTAVLNDPKEILNLCRQGYSGEAYGARVTFSLCRYENSGTNSRTRLDLIMAHNEYIDNTILSIRSDGRVGFGKSNPDEIVDIVGNLKCTGILLINGKIDANTSGLTSSPTTGVYGGDGTRLILYHGSVSSYPYAIGLDNSTMWYGVGVGAAHKFYVGNTERFSISSTGNLKIQIDIWHKSTDGYDRFYYTNNGHSYYKTRDKHIFRNSSDTNIVTIDSDGSTTIDGILVVSGSSITSGYYNFGHFWVSGSEYDLYITIPGISIKSIGLVWSLAGFVASSDFRYKINIKQIENDNALNKILSLKTVSYNYKDYIKKGNKSNIGYIAQDVEKIVPEAISKTEDFIPNIYDIGYCKNNIIYTENIDITDKLNIGDKLKIILEKDEKEIECNITEILSSNSFKIDKEIKDNSKVFIYGKKVDDFRVLNYDMLFSLNISATQALYKMIKELQDEVKFLKNK